jgi:cytochrome P450
VRPSSYVLPYVAVLTDFLTRDFADDTINILMTEYLPQAFASKGIRGRNVVINAMTKYFANKSYTRGSSLIKARYESIKDSAGDSDMARSETVNGIAILANTVPTAFWTIFHIYSDPTLLAEVRSQVDAITGISDDGRTREIHTSKLKDATLIASTLQEALRIRATGTGPRMIMEDITVGGNLLKKGGVAIIANKALHFSGDEWGSDVEAFRAERFCGKTPAHAFRGFGGGVNLCPGKTFAMTEIQALVAMLVMRFDLRPTDGKWQEPGQDTTNMSLQIAPPGHMTKVDIVSRPAAEDITWKFVP